MSTVMGSSSAVASGAAATGFDAAAGGVDTAGSSVMGRLGLQEVAEKAEEMNKQLNGRYPDPVILQEGTKRTEAAEEMTK